MWTGSCDLPKNWRQRGHRSSRLEVAIVAGYGKAVVPEKTRQAPPDGSTHGSTRKLGRVLKTHHSLVANAWHRTSDSGRCSGTLEVR